MQQIRGFWQNEQNSKTDLTATGYYIQHFRMGQIRRYNLYVKSRYAKMVCTSRQVADDEQHKTYFFKFYHF